MEHEVTCMPFKSLITTGLKCCNSTAFDVFYKTDAMLQEIDIA